MNYKNVSDEEVRRLIKEIVTELEVGEITDSNRETMIAFLKFLIGLKPTAG